MGIEDQKDKVNILEDALKTYIEKSLSNDDDYRLKYFVDSIINVNTNCYQKFEDVDIKIADAKKEFDVLSKSMKSSDGDKLVSDINREVLLKDLDLKILMKQNAVKKMRDSVQKLEKISLN